jgi:hypothetical protein
MTFFSSCDQSIYQQKRLIVQNDTSINIVGVTHVYFDTSSRDTEQTLDTLIAPTESKEYSISYINNGGRSQKFEIWLISQDENNQKEAFYLLYTFNTTKSDDIIISFVENVDKIKLHDYELIGEGSGFIEIEKDYD